MENMRGFRKSWRHHEHKASIAALLDDAEPQSAVRMEGMLKKRLAKMPVMHDRYCVATWEWGVHRRKSAILRSYKSRKAHDVHPDRPSSVSKVKCISNWDGKTGFHRYKHAFILETCDKKLFQCVAPTLADKNKWIEFMASQSTLSSRRRGHGESVGPLRRSQSVVTASSSDKPRTNSSASMDKTRRESTADADRSTCSNDPVSSINHNGLCRTMSGASLHSLELPDGDKSEPADWGLYGETNHEIESKYEVLDDVKLVLLETELMDTRGTTKTLESDEYLFEEAGVSRFGAVVVKVTTGSDDDDDGDTEFIDVEFAAREAQREIEKKMKQRAQKLESNRDLYAEMAAARLANMRKDARQSKKSHTYSRLSADCDDSEVDEYDENQSLSLESEEIVQIEDTNQPRSSQSHYSAQSQQTSGMSTSDNIKRGTSGEVSGDNEEDEEVEMEIAPMMESERKELRRLKKKYRAERRANKRLIKEKEEEERTAIAAAQLARAHREDQRLREEAKTREEQEKRNKKERRKVKEKVKQEKLKQRQAEAELQKVVALRQAEDERRERERKDRKEKKKSIKMKYTSPVDRIHKKEERDAKRLINTAVSLEAKAQVSNALVVVEKPVDFKPTKQRPSASTVTLKPPSLSAQPETIPISHAAFASVSSASTTPVPALNNAPSAHGAAQAVPMYQVAPPPFVPAYPASSQSMPVYGLAATFGSYPPFYTAPYSYGRFVGLQSLFPNTGYAAGLGAMGSLGKPAGPDIRPTNQDSTEPMVGPQLPTPDERAAASSPAPCAKLVMNLPELPDVVEF